MDTPGAWTEGWLWCICDGYARGLASQNGIKPQPIDLPSRISQLACHLVLPGSRLTR